MTKRFVFHAVSVVFLLLPLSPFEGQSQTSPPGDNDAVVIHNGFITGQQFRDLPDVARKFYAAGIVDGVFLAPLFGASKPRLEWLEGCVVGMTDVQIAAIISKYLDDNPARWHQSVHAAAYSALRQSCPNAPKN